MKTKYSMQDYCGEEKFRLKLLLRNYLLDIMRASIDGHVEKLLTEIGFSNQCHGKNHDGNGPVGQSFRPVPTDLQGAKVQHQADGYLFYDISYGSPNGRQPALATTVSVNERWQVVAYIKSLGLR